MKNFRITCIFCGNEEQDKFQTTINDWDGYSEYTVLNDGCVEFKCLKCGTFGSSDEFNSGANNKIDMFEITCNQCGSHDYSYMNTLGDEDIEYPYIKCKNCGARDEKE